MLPKKKTIPELAHLSLPHTIAVNRFRNSNRSESHRIFSIRRFHVTFIFFFSSGFPLAFSIRDGLLDSCLSCTLNLLTISSHSGRYYYKVLITRSNPPSHAHIPILGHERSLTQIKFNKEGDLIFSCSKDHVINAWFSHNGERLGTYDGHNGTIWTIDVDCTSLALFNLSHINITDPSTSSIQIPRLRFC